MIIRKDFWHVTKNGVKAWFSYPDKRNAKGFATLYGGEVATEYDLGDSLPSTVFNPETERLMTVAEKVGNDSEDYPYKILIGSVTPQLLMRCETLKQANDIVKILAQSQKKVYVTTCM